MSLMWVQLQTKLTLWSLCITINLASLRAQLYAEWPHTDPNVYQSSRKTLVRASDPLKIVWVERSDRVSSKLKPLSAMNSRTRSTSNSRIFTESPAEGKLFSNWQFCIYLKEYDKTNTFSFQMRFSHDNNDNKWSASPKPQALSFLFSSANSDANKCTQIHCKLNSINNQIQSGNVNHTFVIIHKQIKKADNWHIPNESCQVPLPSYK